MSRCARYLAVATAALAAAAPASAGVELSALDTSAYPTIRATVVSSAGRAAAPTLTENGSPVVGLTEENLGRSKAVVLAVDDSRSMKGKPLAAAAAAARGFVAQKPAADSIAVLEFGPRPIELSDFSTATIDADAALRDIAVAPRDGTALYDAIVLSAQELGSSPLAGRVLIVLTDGRDVSSQATLADAVAAAHHADVSIYPIGMEGQGFDPTALQTLARETGGRYFGAASTDALARVYSSIAQELGHSWRVSYVTSARPGDRLHLEASVAHAGSAADSLVIPVQAGDVAAAPAPSKLLPTGAYSSASRFALGALVGLLVFAAAFVLLAARKGTWLRNRLAAHTGGQRRARRRRRGEQRSALLGSILRATERAFGDLRQWQALQKMLDRGQTPLRAAEFLYLVGGVALVTGLLSAAAGAPVPVILIVMVAGALVPFFVVWRRMRRRLGAFEAQLPDLLITIAAALKAGHSFKQGVQAVVDEGQAPASDEFKRVLTETGLGRPIDDALGEMAERLGSENFEFAITAVNIQRQVGGSLASLFDMVADTVRQRQQFARKIRSLTAMGRMSAYTLIGLPFFLALAISVLNSGYLRPLFHTSTGHLLLMLGMAMMAVGSAIIKKIVSFKG
ncbi:MAG TPA: VWA domain-containing protein [Gaiellaceae bacterium]|nr:VWA domain-containing protein [Gaiellaceae bacterium]